MLKAPDFSLPDEGGVIRSLRDYSGRWLVLYFYPADDTPGCTAEACEFRDGRQELQDTGAQVVGISPDSVASHRRFADRYALNFTLLSDQSKSVLKAYGAWGPRKLADLEPPGVLRKTFLINARGEVAKEYPKVTPFGHFSQVIADIMKLSA
jgi:thioredoxin-dependent peroxiredoxin